MKIYVVYPYALNLGVIEKEAVLCDDKRMRVHEIKDGFEQTEWFDEDEYSLSKEDVYRHAEAIRNYRMAKLKTEYNMLDKLNFATVR